MKKIYVLLYIFQFMESQSFYGKLYIFNFMENCEVHKVKKFILWFSFFG